MWYLAVGDNINAGLSATALLPFVGEVAGGGKIGARVVSKAVGKSVKYSDKMVEATELAVKNEDKIADIGKIADDVVDVGKRGSGAVTNDILESPRVGSALKVDEVSPIYKTDPLTGKTAMVQEFPAGT